MTMAPCLDCGEPSDGPRCTEHSTDPKAPSGDRGYDWQWTQLSRRARRLQPWCTDCGSTTDLQADHSPEAWARKAAGKAVRLKDIDVVCGPCNIARGAARGHTGTRGQGPTGPHPDPTGSQTSSHSPSVRYAPSWRNVS